MLAASVFRRSITYGRNCQAQMRTFDIVIPTFRLNTTVGLHAFALYRGLSAGAPCPKSHDLGLPLRVRQGQTGSLKPVQSANIRSATVVLGSPPLPYRERLHSPAPALP